MAIYHIGKNLKEIASIFLENNFQVFLVGGAVRDWVLKKKCKDYDIATNAEPNQVQQLFTKTIPTGIEHGTVTILYKGDQIECTTFRCEADYSDGRHPNAVHYVKTIEEDLSRRDFTMNAIAIDLKDGSIVDPFNGIADIKSRRIKTVGAPHLRFSEDGLRPIRAIRFAAQLGFVIEKETLNTIPISVDVCKKISIERFRDEFIKILKTENPITAFQLLESTGLLKVFLPELSICRNVEQKGMHKFDVLDHSFLACNAVRQNNLIVRLAALFHDIGKPEVKAEDEFGNYTFYKHEIISERITKKIMQRLKFSNKEIDSVCLLIKHHMFNYTDGWTDAAVRRFIVRIGIENIEDLFALRRADGYAITAHQPDFRTLLSFQKRIEKILQDENTFNIKDLAVDGNDLIKAGIKAGPKLGKILKELFETVLDDPEQNTKEILLKIALALNEKF